ncbi:polysaccharide deacetylase family protein [Xenorhabdus sp. Flor]|uniref:polysaccharide deacetylase family protein n=1 Tax=Xenorhabdus cabanillasii TaxID=351673 RepID=UPI0019CEBC17|nr:polysaccharide deacetylase family protein [Xenorhabdus sp. Flor]MBD2813263.1 polysaccharide deacetylase family protein [Xenorhabdus sp. Flor]
MKIHKNILNWLEKIIFIHIGIKFNIIEEEFHYTLKHNNMCILIKNIDPFFYLLGKSELGCVHYEVYEKIITPPISQIMPMPTSLSTPTKLFEYKDGKLIIYYDILGLTYWCLSRSEEINRDNELDIHNRFPATSSHAYKHNYLDRPIVDEWLNIFKQLIIYCWPNSNVTDNKFKINLTHDVDFPFRFKFQNASRIIKSTIGDIIRFKKYSSLIYSFLIKYTSITFFLKKDPYNTFDWIMDVSEENNIKSEFYFICGKTDEIRDGDYDIYHKQIKILLRNIYKRGHIVGLHPSYNSYLDPIQIKNEFARLRQACLEENIDQKYFGGRMHYLRWKNPNTLMSWEETGLNYDSSLGYADLPGFRCSTCIEYPAINPINTTILKIYIRPLIVMECTILEKHYMGVDNYEEALKIFIHYKNQCKKVQGSFTLLWHNSSFMLKKHKKLYKEVIKN